MKSVVIGDPFAGKTTFVLLLYLAARELSKTTKGRFVISPAPSTAAFIHSHLPLFEGDGQFPPPHP